MFIKKSRAEELFSAQNLIIAEVLRVQDEHTKLLGMQINAVSEAIKDELRILKADMKDTRDELAELNERLESLQKARENPELPQKIKERYKAYMDKDGNFTHKSGKNTEENDHTSYIPGILTN